VIKEYLEEVRTDHPSWQQIPRRMLRHRVIQQCARLALGISANEAYISNVKINKTGAINSNNTKTKSSKSEQLKELLIRSERNG
jgi:uncharacterized short protein YbdD (DUF466 family)